MSKAGKEFRSAKIIDRSDENAFVIQVRIGKQWSSSISGLNTKQLDDAVAKLKRQNAAISDKRIAISETEAKFHIPTN